MVALLWVTLLTGCSGPTAGEGYGPEAYQEIQHRLAQGWNTWNTRSVTSQVLLPERVPGFTLELLDALAAAGEVVWIGRGPLGVRDGRIALYLREDAARLISAPDAAPPDLPVHRAILEQLSTRGACFLPDVRAAVTHACADPPAGEFRAALWDLVWDGWITNDTFSPLKSLGRSVSRSRRRSSARGSSRRHRGRGSL